MRTWLKGADEIRDLLKQRDLERVSGAAADGSALLTEAGRRLNSSRRITDDPSGAFTLAYDAARLACTALLIHQGLRPTSSGGHIAVERAMKAQFAPGFRDFGWMRRRRNEVQYPSTPDASITPAEYADAADATENMITQATALIEQLGLFRE